ncbi:response regulator [Runella slithyformis]|uniref:Two component transcriptional regulator, winged helix family n=1 Tax=Runella slithyformis (strain ATCC 29530 / DSM 19594 / LMG 11500 / NCIMB 11436 / LSU 4) TaxID=761193 RepID=A0A7U4E3M2_RUNSL|nr:response regulator transcription factor [Runella slithyformis]AEI46488.1 two component transcriptional regulator, winged helix family [Runella slithyformis DSM 19594]
MKILLIEDDVKIIQSLRKGLEENGYDVDIAYDGMIGKVLARRNDYSVIVSDIIIPGVNGVQLCRELRNEGILTPFIMLTALGALEEKLVGFDAGADDYLVKPFDFLELLARIKVVTKRIQSEPVSTNVLRYADLEMNLTTRDVTRSHRRIELTGKEYALLEFLLRNSERVLSKVDIAEKIWDIRFDTGTNIIEVYITLLRKKIDKDFPIKLIHTHYGIGYVLKQEA